MEHYLPELQVVPQIHRIGELAERLFLWAKPPRDHAQTNLLWIVCQLHWFANCHVVARPRRVERVCDEVFYDGLDRGPLPPTTDKQPHVRSSRIHPHGVLRIKVFPIYIATKETRHRTSAKGSDSCFNAVVHVEALTPVEFSRAEIACWKSASPQDLRQQPGPQPGALEQVRSEVVGPLEWRGSPAP